MSNEVPGGNEFFDDDFLPMTEINDESAVEETAEDYGVVDDDDPPGVPAPLDLEDQNEERDDA